MFVVAAFFSLFASLGSVALAADVVEYFPLNPVTVYCLHKKGKLLKVTTLTPPRSLYYKVPAKKQFLETLDGERDTNGFYSNITIPKQGMPEVCESENGFYVSGSLPFGRFKGVMPPLTLETGVDERFLEFYEPNGKVKPARMARTIGMNAKRFGKSWNNPRASSFQPEAFAALKARVVLTPWDMPDTDILPLPPVEPTLLAQFEVRKKSEAIMKELAAFADRTHEFDLEYLFLGNGNRAEDLQEAAELSIREERNYGFSPKLGAWDVAVQGTAVRKGFESTPCAEFVSEIIREAYTRAGYDFTKDFLPSVETRLLVTFDWKDVYGPQAVRGLADRLVLAGWTPWDPQIYKPKTGAIGMADDASTPGHTYMIAGMDGRFIVDNGSPMGLDIGNTTKKFEKNYVRIMYNTGVFFLPPGIVPDRWE